MPVPGYPSASGFVPASANAIPEISVLPSSAAPAAATIAPSGPPPITVIKSGSEDDPDVQSITIPFRSASSGNFLPMISVADNWISELEFRFVYYLY